MALLWALWIMVPAYVPNPAAALVGGGKPIDGGKCWKDGKRIFGDGKTWRGLIGGILIGIVFGLLQMFLVDFFSIDFLPKHTLYTIIPLAIGGLLGDLIKSFFKRRLGKERGSSWPIADMYDMVAGSLILLTLTLLVTGNIGWFAEVFGNLWWGLLVLAVILILSPLIHRGANIIGYAFGLKDVPW